MKTPIPQHEHRAIFALICAAPYEFTTQMDDGEEMFAAACNKARAALAYSLRSYRRAGNAARAKWLLSHAYFVGMPSKMREGGK